MLASFDGFCSMGPWVVLGISGVCKGVPFSGPVSRDREATLRLGVFSGSRVWGCGFMIMGCYSVQAWSMAKGAKQESVFLNPNPKPPTPKP